jgi:hypothetical protein
LKCDLCSERADFDRRWSDDGDEWTRELRCAEHFEPGIRHAFTDTASLRPIVIQPDPTRVLDALKRAKEP